MVRFLRTERDFPVFSRRPPAERSVTTAGIAWRVPPPDVRWYVALNAMWRDSRDRTGIERVDPASGPRNLNRDEWGLSGGPFDGAPRSFRRPLSDVATSGSAATPAAAAGDTDLTISAAVANRPFSFRSACFPGEGRTNYRRRPDRLSSGSHGPSRQTTDRRTRSIHRCATRPTTPTGTLRQTTR